MIDTAREINADGTDQRRIQMILPYLFLYSCAQSQHRFFRIGKSVGDFVLKMHYPAGEIRNSQCQAFLAHFNADEIAGIRIQAEHAWTTTGG